MTDYTNDQGNVSDSDPPDDQQPEDGPHIRRLGKDEQEVLRKRLRENVVSQVEIDSKKPANVHLRPRITAISLFVGAIAVVGASLLGVQLTVLALASWLFSGGSFLLGIEENRVPVPITWLKTVFKKPKDD